MKQQGNKKLTEQQRRYMQFAEDRFELIDTIHDIIDIEFDRRGVRTKGDPHPENPPPTPQDRELSKAKTDQPSNRPCCTLWQRIVNFFTL